MAIRIDPVLHTMPPRIQDEFRREVAGTRKGPISDAVLPLNGALLDRQQRIDGLNVTVQRQADRIEHLERVLVQAQKDAERYQWLREFYSPETNSRYMTDIDRAFYGDGPQLDAAIDEALKIPIAEPLGSVRR